MPMKRELYPENWEWLSKQVRADACEKCELCGAPNRELVIRPKDKTSSAWPWVYMGTVYEGWYPGAVKPTRIVLTVHHIDGDRKNNCRQNLIALCQRCHLRLDIQKHMRNRKKSRQQGEQLALD